MPHHALTHKILHFFLIKIIVGVVIIVGLVALVELLGRMALDKTSLTDTAKNLIVAVAEASLALAGYIFTFRIYEKRRITELSASTFGKNAIIGFATGFLLQTLFIAVIYLTAIYSVVRVNPISTLVPAFNFALTAGFVAEILLIGVVFRLAEEQTGTVFALIIFVLLFAVIHAYSKDATILSVSATAAQAGLLLPAAYIFSRSLWLPIILHFAWDFAEPGIFGGINPSTSLAEGLLASKIAGSEILTGGLAGPQSSLQALILCLIASGVFLVLAMRKNNFVRARKRLLSRVPNDEVSDTTGDATKNKSWEHKNV